ncbi:UNVERIFIED_CONTAM: hypothetical protein FKN15_063470 [Acipenser sinensis]
MGAHFINWVIVSLWAGCSALVLKPVTDTVISEVGGNAMLEIKPPGVLAAMAWTFSPAGIPVVSWTGFQPVIGAGYENRVTLNTATGSVELRSVNLSDAGVYTFQGNTVVSGTLEQITGSVTLEVCAPVSQPTVRSNVTDPVEFNDTVSLTCTASGSAVSYRWLNGSSVVSDSERIHLSDNNKTLTIPRVLRSDDGTLYCYAFNPVSDSTSEPFHLIVSYGPESLTLSISPQKLIYSAGSDLTLSCSAQSSPPAHYQWFFNGAPLNKLGSQLNMTHIQHNQTGNYTCWAYNNITLRYAKETREIIVVEPVSQPTVRSNVTDPVEFNDTVSLTCTASGSAVSYQWLNGSSVVSDSERIHLSDDNKTLTIPRVLRSDDGTLYCYAFNPVSNSTSEPFHLIPILNNTFNLTCEVSGLGVADSRLWMMDGHPLSTNDRTTLSVDNSTVSFNPVLLSDNGTYQCTASNLVSNETGAGYKLIVNYGPEEVSIMAPDLAANGSAIMLTCSARSQPPSHYTWYLNGKQTANGSQYMIDPVSTDNQGNYTCVAWNSVTGRNSSAIKELSVIELITEVSVNHTPAQPILNDSLSLTCDVSGTVDSMHWLKDGQSLFTDDRITLSGENSTVSFNPVLLTDNGTYRCTANNRLSNKTSDGYILVVNYGPEEASIMAPDLAANGSAIMLTCSARSQPPSHYTWYLNGKQTANGSQYMIDPVSTDNQGNYTCVAWNSVTGRNSSAIKELTVIELINEVSVNHTHAQPILNDNLSLTCDVSGTVDSMHWLKDGQPLSTDDRITLSGKNSTVSFNPVLLTDKGTYQCTANNPFSNKTSDGYTLFVNYGPEQASITGPQLAAVGSSVTLTCSAPSQPPCGYTWYFNGTETAQGSHYKMSPVSSDNSGPYTCVARNSVTGNSSSAVMELIVIAPISNINVKPTPAQPLENNTFSLTCNVTGTADSRLWWKDDQPLSTTERITLSGDNSTVSFNPVLQSDNGTYQCTASNPVSQLNSTGYRLDVNYGPQHVSISGPDSAVKGSTVTFTCSAHSQPSCEYMWYFKGKERAKGSQYKISAVSTNNNGGYTCVAWNSVTGRNSSAVKDLVVTDSVTKVTVNSPSPYPILNNTFSLTCNVSGNADSRSWLKDSQPLSADGPEQVSITGPDASRIGSTAVFTCSAHSQPVCEYTWFINGKLVAKGSPYKIHPVNSSNDGSYTCTAWNSLTERNSSAVKMHHVLALDCQFVDGSLKQVDAGLGLVFGVNDAGAVFMRFGNKWVPMEGNLRHVTVGPAGLWGVNEDFHIFRMVAGKWERVEALDCQEIDGRLKQIDASDGQVFGVNSEDSIYTRYGNGWVRVPGALKHVTVGPAGVWGVNKDNLIYKMVGGRWEQAQGLLKQIDAGGDQFIAGVNMLDNIFCLNRNPTVTTRGGAAAIPWNLLPGALKYYSCGPYSCWGVNAADQIYVMKGVTPDACMGSKAWQQVPGALSMIEVSTDGSVYGVNSAGNVYRRDGVSVANPAGTDWTYLSMCGKSKHVSYDLGVLWVISPEDKILTCS